MPYTQQRLSGIVRIWGKAGRLFWGQKKCRKPALGYDKGDNGLYLLQRWQGSRATKGSQNMCRVKYFINKHEPEGVAFASEMRNARIDFSSIPTSGPVTLWVDGCASYGPTEVRRAIEYVIRSRDQQSF